MIPSAYITHWRRFAPWPDDYQVEQDLVLSRVLLDIFNSNAGGKLALRGGTALNKLIVREPVRYSEDIDLVQLEPGPIGGVFESLRSKLDHYLGTPKRNLSRINATLRYRFDSETEPAVPLKLKIEINTREHLPFRSLEKCGFSIESPWYTGECAINTYCIEELLATKTRALFQRSKGRDLFDLWYIMRNHRVNMQEVLSIFRNYMESEGICPDYEKYADNVRLKLTNNAFHNDVKNLLRRGVSFDPTEACEFVLSCMNGAGYA